MAKTHKFLRQRVFHDGTSMIVAKAGQSHPVPADLLDDFVMDKTIEKPKGWKHPDGDDVDDSHDEDDGYTVTQKSPGRWTIAGPDMEPEIFAGTKVEAQKRADAIKAERAGSGDDGNNGGAPAE